MAVVALGRDMLNLEAIFASPGHTCQPCAIPHDALPDKDIYQREISPSAPALAPAPLAGCRSVLVLAPVDFVQLPSVSAFRASSATLAFPIQSAYKPAKAHRQNTQNPIQRNRFNFQTSIEKSLCRAL